MSLPECVVDQYALADEGAEVGLSCKTNECLEVLKVVCGGVGGAVLGAFIGAALGAMGDSRHQDDPQSIMVAAIVLAIGFCCVGGTIAYKAGTNNRGEGSSEPLLPAPAPGP